MKKLFIRLEIDGNHYKSWFEDLTKEKMLIDGTKHYEVTIDLSRKDLLEKILKNAKAKDMILDYLGVD